MANPGSPGSDTDRIYVCSHCPKRYARKDYLERHELNLCPACGKGFARPDVLRKHLSTSCKSRRGSDGDAPAPLTTAEEDALVPRKRRRPQRRNTNVSADSPGAGSDDGNPRPHKQPILNRGYSYPSSSSGGHHVSQHSSFGLDSVERDRLDRLGRLDGHLNGRLDGRHEGLVGTRAELLRNLDPSAANSSALSDREDSASPRFDDSPRFTRTMLPPSSMSPRLVRDETTAADGPARAGASLDLPLAPAFAATPETLGPLSFTPKPTNDNDFQAPSKNVFNLTLGSDGMPSLASVGVGSGVVGLANSDNASSNGSSGVEFPSVMPAEVTPDLTWSGSGSGSDSSEHSPEGVDDLFSWLFNVANTTQQGAVWPHTPGVDEPLKDLSSDSDLSSSLPTPPEPAHAALPGLESPLFSTNTNPRSLPHSTTNFPGLPEQWRDGWQWCLPPPADPLDARSREELLSLFEGNLRGDMLSPAFSLSQMRLYFELYFSLGYRRLPPDLLLTILCIGTAFAEDKEGFRIAMRIHKRLRHNILEQVELEPCAPLQALQTILLLNYFSQHLCGKTEQQAAEVFHGSSIVMARLAGVFHPIQPPTKPPYNPLDHWLSWVAFEEGKRVGWFAFMVDTSAAAMFRLPRTIDCMGVYLDWPAPENLWTACEPYEWNRLLGSASLPSFHKTLRSVVAHGAVSPATPLLNLWILLHGLLSASLSLGFRAPTRWKQLLLRGLRAIDNTLAGQLAQRKGHQAPMDLHHYFTGIPLAHLGQILLLTDTDLLRVFVGERPTSTQHWSRASAYLQTWARSSEGVGAFSAAIALLDNVFQWAHERRTPAIASIVPRACYFASLVLWAYSTIHEGLSHTSLPAYVLAIGEAKIEPSLARRDALDYLARMGQIHPYNLPAAPGKNRCTGPIAYAAYLIGALGSAGMEENKAVLMRLLTTER